MRKVSIMYDIANSFKVWHDVFVRSNSLFRNRNNSAKCTLLNPYEGRVQMWRTIEKNVTMKSFTEELLMVHSQHAMKDIRPSHHCYYGCSQWLLATVAILNKTYLCSQDVVCLAQNSTCDQCSGGQELVEWRRMKEFSPLLFQTTSSSLSSQNESEMNQQSFGSSHFLQFTLFITPFVRVLSLLVFSRTSFCLCSFHSWESRIRFHWFSSISPLIAIDIYW